MTHDPESITPRIGPIEPVTMRCDYQLPWERQSNQTACGRTIQNQNGDRNWRIVIEGILSISQLQNLRNIRGRDSVEVVTAEFGKISVAFDQLNVTRADEEATGRINGNHGILLSFQLQTKELETDDEDSLL